MGPQGGADLHFHSPQPDTSQLMLQDHGYVDRASYGVPVYTPAFAGTKLYCLVTEAHWCEVNNLPKLLLDSAAAMAQTH